jgi:hypothetical protein
MRTALKRRGSRPNKEFRPMYDSYSPASLYAGLIGAVLLVVGIVGFLYSASFGDPGEVGAVIGVFDVNAWHNIVHILSGALGLVAFRAGLEASRIYALAFGLVYLVVAIWGSILGNHEAILGFLPVNTEDNVLHAVLAVTGIAAYLASKPRHEVDVPERGPRTEP